MSESFPGPHNDPEQLRQRPPKKSGGLKAGLVALGAVIVKFLSEFKFLLVFLKSGGSMLLTIWLYAQGSGWPFAIGLVVLILIHELGHVIAAKLNGLKVSAPVFIPFFGAYVMLKDAPDNPWVQSWVSFAGPFVGALGGVGCIGIFAASGDLLYLRLAETAFVLNLINLIPIPMLDGGKIFFSFKRLAVPQRWTMGWACAVLVLGLILGWHLCAEREEMGPMQQVSWVP